MRVLASTSHRTMPWKNGGGSTTEIAVAPEGAGLDGFDWRISMATVAADGPFSVFPAVDRTLAVLDGEGLMLHGLDGGPVRLDRRSDPFGFPADAAVAATLLAGPVVDLNVMTRRGRFRSRLQRVAAAAIGRDVSVALLLAGSSCGVTVDGGPPIGLDRWDALRLDDPAGRRLTLAARGPAAAWLVELSPA